jgi:hypothetical protein
VQGLLLKLSTLDAAAENAVRLISFFDALVEQQVGLDALLRNAAVIAECDVGLQDAERRLAVRAAADGTVGTGRAGPSAAVRMLGSGHAVWIARGRDAALPLDEILLERLAIACVATIGRGEPSAPALGDPALLELVIGRSATAAERSRALHLLGISPAVVLTLLAVRGPTDALDALMKRLAGPGRPRRARLGAVYAVAVVGTVARDLRVPAGVRVGVGVAGPATEALASWEGALRALRYASTSECAAGPTDRPVVFQADLGPFELLAARLRSADISGVADIDVLDRLAGEPAGADVVRAVEVVVETGTLREAARQLHLHHNSVAARVMRAEERLGYRIMEPTGTARVGLALALRRLRDNDLLV